MRVFARYALRSRYRNLASVHHSCEWQRASSRTIRVPNFWDNRLVVEILAKSGIMANLEVQDYELLVCL